MAADKISANITYTDPDGKSGSKAITDLNPFARDYATKQFCTALIGLTNNTMKSIEKIERTDITTPKNMTAYSLRISHAATHRQAFKNKLLTVDIEYEDFADAQGWQTPTISGTKPKNATITVEKHEIKIQLSDDYFEQGTAAAFINVEIKSAAYPDSYILRGTICISGFVNTDLVTIE